MPGALEVDPVVVPERRLGECVHAEGHRIGRLVGIGTRARLDRRARRDLEFPVPVADVISSTRVPHASICVATCAVGSTSRR